jgi:hypothetical protein
MIFLYLYRNPKFQKSWSMENAEYFALLPFNCRVCIVFHTVLQVFIYRALKVSNIYNKTLIGFSAFKRRGHHNTQQ